jgi:methyl-accepting chemotaxis protein
MLILILKFLAGIIAATVATKIVILKTGHEGVGPWHVGKWSFTTEALLSVGALWFAFAFSTGTDVLKYRGDARTAADQRKKSEELINRQNEIKNLAATANDQIERAANNLAGVAKTTTETLDSVNTANSTLKASAGTLNQVVQRQIDATVTASETLGRLTETSTLVRRSSKPLRPLEFTLHVKYEYAKTSDEIRNFVNNVKIYVDNIGLNDKARGDQRQRDNWTATPRRIHITGPSALLALGGHRVEQILTSGTVGVKIRPTETESGTVTNDQVAMIAHEL